VPYHVAAGLNAGDILWVDFEPPIGHEQAGRRPALVVSPRSYNDQSSLVLVCPISRSISSWAFKVEIKDDIRTRGAVLVDQVRSIDRELRFVRRADRVSMQTLDQVNGMFAALFGIRVSN
jgi:mRNA interferase MazF